MKRTITKILLGIIATLSIGTFLAISASNQFQFKQFSTSANQAPQENLTKTLPLCDGTHITENCQDNSGIAYRIYRQHEAIAETTKQVTHAAIPAVTRIVHHPAVTGTRQVRGDCIRTSISYKHGTCALSQCRDGSYSGSTGRGTCSYHGGVARSGGPWYQYRTETYIVTPAWNETIVVEPAKPAWTETVIDIPAQPAYLEKVPM